MQQNLMSLKILLPFKIFELKSDVLRIVAETKQGSIGLLPHRLDIVAAISPGILRYEQEGSRKVNYVGLDEGILIKTGLNVVISARNAIVGSDLKRLQETVEQDFMKLSEAQKNAQDAAAKMEGSFVIRLARFQNEL